jgi:hypothetical protein
MDTRHRAPRHGGPQATHTCTTSAPVTGPLLVTLRLAIQLPLPLWDTTKGPKAKVVYESPWPKGHKGSVPCSPRHGVKSAYIARQGAAGPAQGLPRTPPVRHTTCSPSAGPLSTPHLASRWGQGCPGSGGRVEGGRCCARRECITIGQTASMPSLTCAGFTGFPSQVSFIDAGNDTGSLPDGLTAPKSTFARAFPASCMQREPKSEAAGPDSVLRSPPIHAVPHHDAPVRRQTVLERLAHYRPTA